MIEVLLSLGGDPNQLWFGNTPWQHALTRTHMISFNRAKLQQWAFILERMLHYSGTPYTTCTHNHDIRFPVYSISPPHSANAVITDTFHSTLTPQETKLQHLLVEKMASNPPPVDLEDLEIMQIETSMQHMMYELAGNVNLPRPGELCVCAAPRAN